MPSPSPPPAPRSDASREELAELAQQANPEEIELGEDEDEDEMDLEPNGQGPAGQVGPFRGEARVGPPPGLTGSPLPPSPPPLLPRGAVGAAERAGRCVREPEGGLTPALRPPPPNTVCVCIYCLSLFPAHPSPCPGACGAC